MRLASSSFVFVAMQNPPKDRNASGMRWASIDPDVLVRVGKVYRPHGVHGELKIAPDTDDTSQFEHFEVVFVGPKPRRVAEHAVESVRYQETKRGTTVILKLAGLDDRNDAERIAKQGVFVREDALVMEDDEVLVSDLIGAEVVTEEGEDVGTIANLLELPGHDVLVVRRDGKAEAMIPAVDDFIVEIDMDARRVVIRPIEGLLD